MATYSELEDLRDWFIDLCGEFLARTDSLEDESKVLLSTVRDAAEGMHQDGIKVIAGLDAILVAKKRAESPEP
jgi:hypothetical protein